MADGGTAFTTDYTRLIEVLDGPAGSVVTTLCNSSSNIDLCVEAEFELLRQGGCGGGTFKLDMDFYDGDIPAVGQWIRCSYKSGSPLYLGRIEEVTASLPSGIDIRTLGPWAVLTEIQVGGNPWWSGAPQTFGVYDYFVHDPDHASTVYTSVANMQAMIEILYTDYIATYPGGTTGLLLIDAPDTAGTFSSMTFRGGESISQVIRSLAEASGNASYGINASNEFFFIPLNTTSQATFQEGLHCDLKRVENRSMMYNRVVINGGYVYGVNGDPSFYAAEYHYEDAGSVATYGAKTLSIKMPWIRSFIDAENLANGILSKYAGLTTQYSVDTIAQGDVLNPWEGYLTLKNGAGTSLAAEVFDTCKVKFNETPTLSITTGPAAPMYPGYDLLQNQSGENNQGGGGGGGDQGNISGFSEAITSESLDSCFWAPCENKTVGFVVTEAHPASGYVIGDVYYMSRPICPRTGITFFDMENPIGEYVNLGDSALSAGDYVFRMGTAQFLRRYADHDPAGCKWHITGLWCP